MTSKQRLLCALRRETSDRVPAIAHQWLPYHLTKYLDGIDPLAAFQHFGLDASIACAPMDEPETPDWRIEHKESTSPEGLSLVRRRFHTPQSTLIDVLEMRADTVWTVEHFVKRLEDVDFVGRFMPVPRLDRTAVAREYDLIETGGGAGSSTCISPKLHREFCLPYDREQHDAARDRPAGGLPHPWRHDAAAGDDC